MEIEVRVQPRAKRNSIEVVDGPKLKIYVTAAPESGKANDAVVALLAKALGVSKSSIGIVKGHKARDKVLSVESLSADEVFVLLDGK
jgi:hypothetical protein